MVPSINSLYSLLLFNIFCFVLVMGNSPTYAPTRASLPSSSISTPTSAPTADHTPTPAPLPSSNSSPAPAWISPAPTGCSCSFDLQTVAACSIFLGSPGGIYGIPQALCCRGLRGLNAADICSFVCYICDQV